MKEKNIKYLKNYLIFSSVGITLVVCVVLGYGIGYYLDKFFKTSPYLMLLFTLFGIIAGFLELCKVTKVISKR